MSQSSESSSPTAPGSKELRSPSPCSCPTSLHTQTESITRSYSQCPICLSKFDTQQKLPLALFCSHTLCLNCAHLIYPNIQSNKVINQKLGIVNYPLLSFLDYKLEPPRENKGEGYQEIIQSLCKIARLIKGHQVSRSIHRKAIVLINSLTPEFNSPNCTKLLKPIRSLGERTLVELTSSCAHVSHYHAQQQLWAAIRARACQFMGPAMQDEALKLVLLALEDGSALSRKVLVMFVVQRLAPQFPQASKTSVGHIVQLLYRASAFDVLKRQGNSSLMTLRPEFRNYEALRREHDTQIMKIGLEAGIRFTPEQWSSLLYGDTSQKPLMQSIIDKLQSPQTFQELLKEYLVSVQRLSDPDSQFLVSLHLHFKVLSMIETGDQNNASPPPPLSPTLPDQLSPSPTNPPPLPALLESLFIVLSGLITFTTSRKNQRGNPRPPQQQQQQHQPNNNNSTNGVMMMYSGNNGAPNNKQHHHPHHNHHQRSPPPSYTKNGRPSNNAGSNNNLVSMIQANLCI